mgnify:CR=1 FL=1
MLFFFVWKLLIGLCVVCSIVSLVWQWTRLNVGSPLSPLYCKLLVKHFTLDTSRSVIWITAMLNWQWTDRLTLHQIYGKMRYIKAERIVVLLIGYISHKQLFFLYVPEIQNDDYILKVGSEMIYHTDYGRALIAVLTLFLNHSNGFWSPTEIGYQYQHTWTTIMNRRSAAHTSDLKSREPRS